MNTWRSVFRTHASIDYHWALLIECQAAKRCQAYRTEDKILKTIPFHFTLAIV